jgi:SWI/SNF related-matrix-associated actin-dependent regulator of chromatin subfamily C
MYLSSNACRKHLAGDAFAILRIHSFLEHWGLINFKINAKFKPNFIPKAFNFKSPIYIDSNLFMFDNNNPNNNNISNYNNPESNIVLTNQNKNITTLYPINNLPNKIFNNFLNDCISDKENCENSELKKFEKINFLSQNYRPKCDVCGNLCTMDWYITKDNKNEEENDSDNDLNFSINIDEKSLNKEYFIVCETCFGDQNIPLPNNLKRENFELSSIYNLFSKEKLNEKIINKLNEQKWTEEEDKKLLEGLKKDKSWDQLMESFGNDKQKTKQDCILHLLQMPMNNMNEKYNNDNDSEDENEELIEEDEEKGDKIEEIGKADSQEIKDDNKDINEKGIENENNNIINENNINNDINNFDANNNINNTKDIIDENKKNEMIIEESKKDEKNIIDNSNKGLNEKMNNNMIEIFMRLFKRYLNESNDNNENNNDEDNNGNVLNKSFKEVIYKTFAKSINKCKELKDDEKDEMKRIVDILVYLEMKKIELKMNYFKQFERELEYKKTQLKTIETQIIQERIKLITQKLLLQKKQQQSNEINKNNIV